MDNLTRRNIRYICFRIQTEALGGSAATKTGEGIMQYVDEIKEHMEGQDDFGGWDKFAKTWDVDEKSPLVVVSRISSVQNDWNKILKKEVKELPQKKLLQNDLKKKIQSRKKPQKEKPASPQGAEKVAKKASFWDKLK